MPGIRDAYDGGREQSKIFIDDLSYKCKNDNLKKITETTATSLQSHKQSNFPNTI